MMEPAREKVLIRGTLAIPRVSRNLRLYLPTELEAAVQKLGGKPIPVYWEHVAADRAIGTAILSWNPEKLSVEFEAEIFDPEAEQKIRSGAVRHVSLGADYERIDRLDGIDVPRGLAFRELSLVAVPGIPEANITVIESSTAYDVEADLVLTPASPPAQDEKTVESQQSGEKVGGDLDFPVADKDRPWDADAAIARIRKWASSDGSGDKDKIDWAKYRKAFFWYDENDPENFGSYKLPFVDIIDGRPHIIPRAVVAVAAALQGARGGVDIPRDDAEAIKRKVATLYRKIFDKDPPWERDEEAAQEAQNETAGEAQTVTAGQHDISKNTIANDQEAMSTVENTEKKPAEPIAIEAKESLSEKLDENARYAQILNHLREAITGAPSTFTWSRDVIALPPELTAELRQYTDFVEIPRGADRARWYRISPVTFGPGTEGTPFSAASQTVSTIEAVPAEFGAKQEVGYSLIESANIDLVKAVETTMLNGALAREDLLILQAVDSADVTNVVYGGGKSAENQLTASDVFTVDVLIEAIKRIRQSKIAVKRGDLVLVIHPKQWGDLMRDTNIRKAMEWGGPEPIQRGELPELLGCKVLVSTQVPTGTGSGTPPVTTYHAVLFMRGAVGYAVTRDLLIETFRDVNKRQLDIVGTIKAAAKVKIPEACCKIYTA